MTDLTGDDGPLTEAELAQLRLLLRRYCNHQLDQWENLRTETPHGDVYVMFSNALPPGANREMFQQF
ncbi:hypothetical protein ACYSUO_36610 [Streptomyces sp. UC4497]